MRQSLVLLLLIFLTAPAFSQQRVVIRTNQRGQIVRLTVATNNRILKQELIGTIGGAPATPATRPIPNTAPRRRPIQAPAANTVAPPQPEPAVQTTDPPVVVPDPIQRPPVRRTPARPPAVSTHLLGISADFLLQTGNGLSRFSTQLSPDNINTVYAGAVPSWGGIGISVGFNYVYSLPNYLTFIGQIQLDSTGWIFVGLNVGMGLRAPITKTMHFLVDVYFCLGFTGAELPPLVGATLPAGNPSSIMSILSLIGFKGRIAFEFSLPKNMYFTLAVSYGAYPWGFSSAQSVFAVNNINLGNAVVLDAFKAGIEFGWKIPGKAPKAKK